MKMKKNCLILALMAMIPLAHASNKVDYKCYLDTSLGKRLALFSFYKDSVKKSLATLPASKIVVNGNQTTYIKDVIECVKETANFRNTNAQILDRKMAR